jgi:hypothetical protein
VPKQVKFKDAALLAPTLTVAAGRCLREVEVVDAGRLHVPGGDRDATGRVAALVDRMV